MYRDMSGRECDFIASSLRMHVNRLQNILKVIEAEKVDCTFTFASLKEVEAGLREIRKVCGNN